MAVSTPQITLSAARSTFSIVLLTGPWITKCSRNQQWSALGKSKLNYPTQVSLEQVCKRILPPGVYKFLFGPLSEFPVVRRLTGILFGALSGVGLFFGLLQNIAMTTVQRVVVGCVFVALCSLGGMFSSLFRCSVLLMFPSMIGSQGRTFLMIYVLHGLYQGPIVNIQRNVQDVASSMGCNIDLQITHSKVMWRMLTEPYVQVVQEIVNDSGEFQEETQNVSKQFQNIRDEVMGQYGYDSLGKESAHTSNSTQEEYVVKTRARCDYVVQEGIGRCQEWFNVKWEECMNTIQAPLINHFLCVPLHFHFLCNIMRVMTSWCGEKIPVEGNFGQTFDKLNDSINRLAEHFTTNVVLEKLEQQSVFGVDILQDFSKELSRVFQEKTIIAEKIAGVINFLLSFTFITVFTSAFGYVRQYCRNIHFDNVYITTYFRQIDARRMGAIVGFLQVASLALFVCVLLAVDGILYNIFDLIRRHTFTTYSVTGVHHIDIVIGGDSMLARLLRKTIGAFNTSSNLDVQSSNFQCLPQPHPLSQSNYFWIFIPLLLMCLMCCLQVYTNRLRRVITAFYFPKVLSAVLAPLKRVGCRLRWCWVCDEFVSQNQAVECSSAGCTMIYCQQCWTDLDNICYACFPQQSGQQDSGSESDVYYGC
ncbi:DC-STAMP domain-containing 1 [Labeo rohita]|uniref:DC-STAMP domain-containing 1 n=1 Tax=Labeo rohita TaxID=84645 RepID=A0A498NFL6_LABRO|nr:DC-STAMP domain-containing 1 [Labeo rohita]